MESKMGVVTEIEQQRICADCVGELFLKARIVHEGRSQVCFYCSNETASFSVLQIANAVESALSEHYYITPENPDDMEYFWMSQSDYQWYREGHPVGSVIRDCAQVREQAAEDIRRVLEARHFDFGRQDG